MKLSTKSRYGVRLLLDLALQEPGRAMPLVAVAERQGISPRYLEQVAADLRKAGMLRAVKGAQGGYLLAMDPAQIHLGVLVALLEGDLLLTDPPAPLATAVERCLWREFFSPLNDAVDQYLNHRTLQDLVAEYRQATDTGMYYL